VRKYRKYRRFPHVGGKQRNKFEDWEIASLIIEQTPENDLRYAAAIRRDVLEAPAGD